MKRHFISKTLSVLALGFAVSMTAHAHAHEDPQTDEAFFVAPMEISMKPGDAAQSLMVFNHHERAIDVRVDAFEREDTVEGIEKRVLTKDLVADVSEFTLAPGAKRAVKVRYVGRQKLKRERAFRVVIKQMSSSLASNPSLDLRFIYVASVYVSSKPHVATEVQVNSIQKTPDGIEVELKNRGLSHLKLRDVDLVVAESLNGDVRNIELSTETREHLKRQNILAGGLRRLRLQVADFSALRRDGRLKLELRTLQSPR